MSGEHDCSCDDFEQLFLMGLDAMCIADMNTATLERVNPAMCMLIGYDEDYLCSRPFTEFVHPEDLASTGSEVQTLLNGQATVAYENRWRTASGEWVWLEWCAQPAASGRTYAIARDITERKASETAYRQRMEQLVTVDPLTGVLNLRGGEEGLRSLVEPIGVVMIDVDDFKNINELCGHAVGNRVLKEVAMRIRNSIRPTDVVSRVGGDEFMALLQGSTPEGVLMVGERIRTSIASVRARDPGSGATVAVTASLGVTLIERAPKSLEAVLSATRTALAQSKGDGKNRVVAAPAAEGPGGD